MTASANHISGETGLTLVGFLSKNGSTFVETVLDISEVGFGWYSITLSTADTNTIGDLVLHLEAAGADPTDIIISIIGTSTPELHTYLDELHTIAGLKVGSPSTTTQSSWNAGAISIAITGNGETTTTMTRQ